MISIQEREIIANFNIDILSIIKNIRSYIVINNIYIINENDIQFYDREDIIFARWNYYYISYSIVDKTLYRIAFDLFAYLFEFYPAYFDIANRMVNSHYARLFRLRKFLKAMLADGKCLFLTLTFTDDVLNSTSAKTRRVYIRRFLSQFKVNAVANIDFGDINDREHYHAIISLPRINHKLYTYGNLNFQLIRSIHDVNALSSYVCCFANHALKESTQNSNSLIYIHKK